MNDNITEINKDTFWKLIQSAKETCGQDMDAMMDFLKDRLVSMGPEQAQNSMISSTPIRTLRTSLDCGTPPGS